MVDVLPDLWHDEESQQSDKDAGHQHEFSEKQDRGTESTVIVSMPRARQHGRHRIRCASSQKYRANGGQRHHDGISPVFFRPQYPSEHPPGRRLYQHRPDGPDLKHRGPADEGAAHDFAYEFQYGHSSSNIPEGPGKGMEYVI